MSETESWVKKSHRFENVVPFVGWGRQLWPNPFVRVTNHIVIHRLVLLPRLKNKKTKQQSKCLLKMSRSPAELFFLSFLLSVFKQPNLKLVLGREQNRCFWAWLIWPQLASLTRQNLWMHMAAHKQQLWILQLRLTLETGSSKWYSPRRWGLLEDPMVWLNPYFFSAKTPCELKVLSTTVVHL